jgi:hypothetical protein
MKPLRHALGHACLLAFAGGLALPMAGSACTTTTTTVYREGGAPGEGSLDIFDGGAPADASTLVDGGADCSSVAKAQGPTERCCPAYGIDACANGFFCAALDGRTVPTCSPEHSLKGGDPCTEDRQCGPGKCSVAARRCEYSLNSECDPSVGCAEVSDLVVFCAGSPTVKGLIQSPRKCEAAREGSLVGECGLCRTSADCVNDTPLSCVASRCVAGTGELVSNSECCLNGEGPRFGVCK